MDVTVVEREYMYIFYHPRFLGWEWEVSYSGVTPEEWGQLERTRNLFLLIRNDQGQS